MRILMIIFVVVFSQGWEQSAIVNQENLSFVAQMELEIFKPLIKGLKSHNINRNQSVYIYFISNT